MLNRRDVFLAAAPAIASAAVLPALGQTRAIRTADVAAALAGLASTDLLAGAIDAPVKGVAIVTDPTLATLRKAADAGCSLIFTPETPFYGNPVDPSAANGAFGAMAQSAAEALRNSPAFRAKQALVADRGLTIYRVTPRPAGGSSSAEALAARLGWTSYRVPGGRSIYRPPRLTLAALVELANKRLGARGGLRFIGDPAMQLGSVLLVPGTAEVVTTTQALRYADALLTGDMREWELVEYVHDSAEAGIPKALVATGRILSEQPFLERCALALKQVYPRVNLHSLMSVDPFWRVEA